MKKKLNTETSLVNMMVSTMFLFSTNVVLFLDTHENKSYGSAF